MSATAYDSSLDSGRNGQQRQAQVRDGADGDSHHRCVAKELGPNLNCWWRTGQSQRATRACSGA